jgi:hypothetical protein
VNDHDVFVAKAGDLWEMPCLIGVHFFLNFVHADNLLAFMWGGGVGVSGNTSSGFFLVEHMPSG